MNLSLLSDKRRVSKRLIFATVAVAMVLVADYVSGGAFRGVVRVTHGVVWDAASGIGLSTFGSGYFASKGVLKAENEAFRKRIATLEIELASVEALKLENTRLSELTRLAENAQGSAARITSSLRSSPYGTFLVGAGSADGIAVGDIVMVGGERSVVIGEIAEVYGKSSLVREIFAPGASVEGIVGDAELTLLGRGGGNARAQAPRALALSPGDAVTSREFRGLIGTIGAISPETASAFATIYVRTPVNMSELDFVYVVSRSNIR